MLTKFSLEQLDTAFSGAWEKVEVFSHWVQTRDLHQTPVDFQLERRVDLENYEKGHEEYFD